MHEIRFNVNDEAGMEGVAGSHIAELNFLCQDTIDLSGNKQMSPLSV